MSCDSIAIAEGSWVQTSRWSIMVTRFSVVVTMIRGEI